VSIIGLHINFHLNAQVSINLFKFVEFKVFMVITILIMFFWVKTPCGLVGRSHCFGEVCFLHLQP
jgi:hypothetical protein